MEDTRSTRYVIVTPFRDEEEFIEITINAVIHQSIKPVEWLFIDDNSIDDSPNIVKRYSKDFPFIRIGKMPIATERAPGIGVMRAFNYGYSIIQNKDHEFVVKLDADLSFDQDFFHNIFSAFKRNPKLGIASGLVIDKDSSKAYKVYEENTYGANKIYRKSCFNLISPIEEIKGWDLLDNIKAQSVGFDTLVLRTEKVLHLKPMDSVIGKKRESFLKGYFAAYLHYKKSFLIVKVTREMFEKPYFLGGFMYFLGYLKNYFIDKQFYKNDLVIKYLHTQQSKRLRNLLRFAWTKEISNRNS
jgi:biofilm PGA synthesis N-glycosyltransferase PgaC